jgi:hypothetical protein
VTLEANPGAGDRGDLRGFRAAGVNRLSIGAQSMEPAELRRLGRRHSPAGRGHDGSACARRRLRQRQPRPAVRRPRPDDSSVAATLAAALALEPEHVSAYALTLDDPDAEGLTGPMATICRCVWARAAGASGPGGAGRGLRGGLLRAGR